MADGGVGGDRRARGGAGAGHPPPDRPLAAGARLRGRRLPFAAIQDVGDWVNFSDHSIAQLGVYVGSGTAFDFDPRRRMPDVRARVRAGADPIGAAVRAAPAGQMAAGGARRAGRGGLVLGLAELGVGGSRRSGRGRRPRRAGPASYLLGAQHSDGGFGAAAGRRRPLYAGWAALGLAAAGENPADISHGGASLLDYIRSGAGSPGDPGSLERTILVAGAAGVVGSELRRPGSGGGARAPHPA